MTLEEKARESSINACLYTNMAISQPSYEKGYIAGAKENGFIIHNLNKDPTDLPKRDKRFSTHISIPVLTQDYIHAFYQFDDKKWYSQGKEVKVTKWCEFPQFDLEE